MDAQAALRPPPSRRAPRVPARLLRLAADERLVELVRAGSEPAFEVVFDRYHRGILAFCRHMLGSADEAEDAVQHVFLSAYRSLRADDGRNMHLRAWLYTIARNRCLSVLRARRERPLDEVGEPSTEHLAEAVQRREDLRTMLHDVAGLPDDQRAALVLAELGDVSHEEIAEVLGVRREKVKALVFQARSSLVASRMAREVSCAEVREHLAELRGGSLRRTWLRRHLRECAGCREFRSALTAQKRALAVLLPVAPTAGLKGSVLGSAFGGGGAAAAGASGAVVGGTASSVGGAGLAAKALVVVAVAGSGAAVGTRELTAHHAPPASPAHAAPGGVSRAVAAPIARPTQATLSGVAAIAHENGHRARGRQPAAADGGHGLGAAAGGGRTEAPGQLANGGRSHRRHRSRADRGSATAPGQLKAPGTSARGGRNGTSPASTGPKGRAVGQGGTPPSHGASHPASTQGGTNGVGHSAPGRDAGKALDTASTGRGAAAGTPAGRRTRTTDSATTQTKPAVANGRGPKTG